MTQRRTKVLICPEIAFLKSETHFLSENKLKHNAAKVISKSF